MDKISTVKIVIFILISLGLLTGLALVMTRPISPSVERLEAIFGDKSHASFLIETILKTILVAFVTAFINYFLFKKTARTIIKWKPFIVILTVHIIIALIGSMPYIKMVSDNVY